jgi:Rrf2 family iron-sulfur cluster assembly transcriptional regulator
MTGLRPSSPIFHHTPLFPEPPFFLAKIVEFSINWICFSSILFMLCLSQSVGYAIQALTCLGDDAPSTKLIRDIASETGVPPAYLAKLIKRLADANLVISKRGIKGGTWLRRPPQEISLMEISEAIDGRKWLGRCLLGLEECSEERACPTHEFWRQARAGIEKKLADTTLADVMQFEAVKAAKAAKLATKAAAKVGGKAAVASKSESGRSEGPTRKPRTPRSTH